MSFRLDMVIEELEKIVEMHLNLCNVTWNGIRCILPANHDEGEPHRFGTSVR